jgi:hypothetical protein
MAHTFIEHIAGKVVQRIVLTNDPDAHEIEIQFQDRTGFHIKLDVRMEIELVALRDWKTATARSSRSSCKVTSEYLPAAPGSRSIC